MTQTTTNHGASISTTTAVTPTPTHEHCWHSPSLSTLLASYPPRHEEVCCHCGTRQWRAEVEPPIPSGHGKFYPKPFGNAGTITLVPLSTTNGPGTVR